MEGGNPSDPLRKRSPKATKVIVEQRVNKIIELLCKAWSNPEIKQYAASEWGVSPRQTDVYIQRANAAITEHFQSQDRPTFLAAKLGILEEIARVALRDGQLSAAVGAVNSMLRFTRVAEEK